MENQNYTAKIEVSKSSRDVFNHVNDVSNWWAKDAGEALSGQKTEFEGQSTKLNDEFIIRSGDRHYFKQRLIEVIPDTKVVWQVTDSILSHYTDETECNNTKMVFELSVAKGKTKIDFTHVGLVKEMECYSDCEWGWNNYICKSLPKFFNTGNGIPYDGPYED